MVSFCYYKLALFRSKKAKILEAIFELTAKSKQHSNQAQLSQKLGKWATLAVSSKKFNLPYLVKQGISVYHIELCYDFTKRIFLQLVAQNRPPGFVSLWSLWLLWSLLSPLSTCKFCEAYVSASCLVALFQLQRAPINH